MPEFENAVKGGDNLLESHDAQKLVKGTKSKVKICIGVAKMTMLYGVLTIVFKTSWVKPLTSQIGRFISQCPNWPINQVHALVDVGLASNWSVHY